MTEINDNFPNGYVECGACGKKYDSSEVQQQAHTPPGFTWKCLCGIGKLIWKPRPEQLAEMQKIRQGLI